MRKFLIGLLLFFIAVAAPAQSFIQVWKTALKPFYQQSFDITVDIKIYHNALRLGVLEKTSLNYKKSGNRMRISSSEYDQLVTDKMVIIADHQEQLLLVGPYLKKSGAAPIMSLDSLLSFTKEAFTEFGFIQPNIVKAKNGNIGYLYIEPNDYYSSVEFWFTPDKSKVQKIILIPTTTIEEGLASEQIPAIEYSFVYANTPPPIAVFDTNAFIQKSGKSVQAQKKYSEYTLVSQF